MKKTLKTLFLILLLSVFSQSVFSQRKMEKLDRGIVAVKNAAGNYFVSWRLFATDSEDIQFNLYVKKVGATSFTKLNTSPLTITNFSPTSGTVSLGAQIYVTSVLNGEESTPSNVYKIPTSGFTSYRSGYFDFTFNPANDGLELHKYSVKFVWPADLDGDGEYDFIVDRLSTTGDSHKIQAYLRTGALLWTVDMGPNVSISEGQDDMVTAYDMDNDGKADVVVKSSDGTKFANGLGVNGSTSLDTDNDGIIDYNTQNVKNPPQYITVIDGMSGVEKNSIEMKYPSNYTRTNKAIFMGSEYSNLNGHMAIVYLDGKHPSVGFIYKTRTSSDQYHWYYASAYGYNESGSFVNWYNWERGRQGAAEGHGIRSADVDLDGRDELLDIGYGIKYNGTLAFNANISHGDRFRVGDIDPDRPGLETFAIQQNASSLLGQILYDSGTGEPIKKIYMSSVGDVGRGECMDVDSTHLGYEFWSTMPNIYNAKGNVIYEGSAPFPHEGVWWDGDLAREELSSADGNGFNADIRKYDINSHAFGSRLIEFAKMTNWQVKSEYGVRPAFFGDIIGDWREEVILEKKGTASVTLKDINGNDSIGTVETCPGFVGFSTDYPTTKKLYCLMQNPAYRCQATTKGYYQSAFPDYYLGFNMPAPPVPPIMQAKLTWKNGTTFDKSSSNFVLQDEKTSSLFADGDDILFDISGENSSEIQIPTDLAPSKLWAMNPKGKDYILTTTTGKLAGTMELVKSMNGSFTLNGNQSFTGKTTVSEGTLYVNGTYASPVSVMAKGTFGGNAILNGELKINQALNIEGGRIAPGNGLQEGKLGKMILNGNLNLSGKTNLHFDILPTTVYKNDSLIINGDFTLAGVNNVVINTESGVLPSGTYSLIKWTGTLNGTLANFDIAGISGLPISLIIEDNTLKLVVNATRSASTVTWTGKENTSWDYLSANFKLTETPTYFVNNDSVIFNDEAVNKTVNITDNMIVSNANFANTTAYILKGTGGITGDADLIKTGKGLLDIQTINNNYKGKTILTNALVQVAAMADAGLSSSLGASSSTDPANIKLTDSRFIVNSVTTNSNRGITIAGSDTIEISKSNGIFNLTGVVTGTGNLVKSGAGQLNLSSPTANTYSGETILRGGTIALGTLKMNTNGFGTSGKIRMENGAKIKMYDSSSDYSQSPFWNITIPEGHTASLSISSRCNINGSISGAGTLNFYTPYVRGDLVAGGANFTGKINVTTDDAGDFRITNNTYSFPLANINLGANVWMAAYSTVGASGADASKQVKIGSLSGDATSSVGAGTWIIGSDNRDATYNGVLSAGTFTKTGTGIWTLTNASTPTTTFTISGGTLIAKNTTGSATGTGTVTVSNNATLAGTGIIGGIILISANGKIMPGLTTGTVGTLTALKNVTLTSTSTTIIKVSATANDLIKLTTAATTLFLGGTLDMRNLAGNWTAGKSYTIFSAPTISGTFSAITPATPGDGLEWDLSKINQGIISINSTTPINEINAESVKVYPTLIDKYCLVNLGEIVGKVQMDVFNSNGRKLMTYTETAYNNSVKLDMSHFKTGVYMLRITNSTSSYLYKLIKK